MYLAAQFLLFGLLRGIAQFIEQIADDLVAGRCYANPFPALD